MSIVNCKETRHAREVVNSRGNVDAVRNCVAPPVHARRIALKCYVQPPDQKTPW